MVARLAFLAALLALLSIVTALKAGPSNFKAAFCPATQSPFQGPALRSTKSSSSKPEAAKTPPDQRAHQQRRTEHEWREKFRKGKLMRSVDSMEVPFQSRHNIYQLPILMDRTAAQTVPWPITRQQTYCCSCLVVHSHDRSRAMLLPGLSRRALNTKRVCGSLIKHLIEFRRSLSCSDGRRNLTPS
jgi:hypothetical protein